MPLAVAFDRRALICSQSVYFLPSFLTPMWLHEVTDDETDSKYSICGHLQILNL